MIILITFSLMFFDVNIFLFFNYFLFIYIKNQCLNNHLWLCNYLTLFCYGSTPPASNYPIFGDRLSPRPGGVEHTGVHALFVSQDLERHQCVLAVEILVHLSVLENVHLSVLTAALEQTVFAAVGRHFGVFDLIVVWIENLPRLVVVIHEQIYLGILALH